MTSNNENDTSKEIVYLGAITLANGRVGARWILKDTLDQIADDEHNVALIERVSSAFAAKTATHCAIGGIYRTKVEIEGDSLKTAVFGFAARYIGQYEHNVVTVFEAKSWAAKQREKAASAEKKAKEATIVQRQLKLTVDWIKTFPVSQRRTIADAIVSQLYDGIYRP